jgi:hypothetical protein
MLVIAAAACSGNHSGASAPDTLSLRYVAKSVECGTPQAVDDPDTPGRCIVLGESLFGPHDLTKPVVRIDGANGPGVAVTLADSAREYLAHHPEMLAPNTADVPGPRLTFVFDGQPLPWMLLPGPAANFFVATPSTNLAQRIVASLKPTRS